MQVNESRAALPTVRAQGLWHLICSSCHEEAALAFPRGPLGDSLSFSCSIPDCCQLQETGRWLTASRLLPPQGNGSSFPCVGGPDFQHRDFIPPESWDCVCIWSILFESTLYFCTLSLFLKPLAWRTMQGYYVSRNPVVSEPSVFKHLSGKNLLLNG